MTNIDTPREIKKKLLRLEKENKISKLREQLAHNGLLDSGIGSGAIARLEIEYKYKEKLIDYEDYQTPIAKVPIFKKSPKYLELWRLEKLFREKSFETYPKIAVAIGNIMKETKFRPQNKKHILKIKETFNKYSKKEWGLVLKANRKVLLDGLNLIPAK